MPSEPNPPKVFISYSHDSQEHFDRVLLLSDTLREWGIDCHIDQYELAPADWLRWMERRIREADFVLIVCTETYCRRFNGEEEPGKGLGVRHEGGVISVELYNRQTETAKFIPVVFSAADSAHIPTPLQATNRHALDMEQLETDRGFENLYRQLTSQPRVIPKPLGKIRPLPPINRKEELGETPPAASRIEEPSINLKEKTFDVSSLLKIGNELGIKLPKHESHLPPKPQISTPIPALAQQNFTEDLGNGVKLEMIAIPGGSFQMGSEDFENTKPVHPVTLSPFHLGKFQVTQSQWQAVMKTNPSFFKGDTLPVEQVSWDDAVEFCEKLSKKTGKTYRLPTEAEWEYGCLAGSTGKYCFGDDESLLRDYAWFGEDWQKGSTHPVGQKKPNNWGLYDMHGNVWEWCQDWYDANYYAELSKKGEAVNPQGPANGERRVLRGGSWDLDQLVARAVYRGDLHPAGRSVNLGFRVVLCRPPSSS